MEPSGSSEALDLSHEMSRGEMLVIDTVANAVQARHLQTDLHDAEWVDPGEAAQEAAARLRLHEFDQAPVGRPGDLLGFVLVSELANLPGRRVAGSIVHGLDARHVMSATASVLAVLEALDASEPIVFVVDGRTVSGFVTASDLNRHPARTHFYLLLSSLEVVLADWVRREYPDQSEAVDLLGREGRKVRTRYSRDQRANVAVDLVTGMDLWHLLTIVGVRRDGQMLFGAPSVGGWDAWVTALRSLRNSVMHPVLTLLGEERTTTDLLTVERALRDVLLGRETGP